MNRDLLTTDLEREEGCRLVAYRDTRNVLTIGYGHTGPDVHEGLQWTQQAADQQLDHDIDHVCGQMDVAMPWWRSLDDVRANVMVKMAFQLGIGGLLAFRQMLAHVRAEEWDLAKAAGLDSQWAKQTPERAKREMDELETGVHA
jgi:lysozyme